MNLAVHPVTKLLGGFLIQLFEGITFFEMNFILHMTEECILFPKIGLTFIVKYVVEYRYLRYRVFSKRMEVK